ncbi:hypothetical protein [Streptomyces chartreusis]|uniref:hypothetical protein n=1 Tax=Streptomyces chartreusis TaxID=1969 RepID=UPI003870909B|nr:hypothetical protein OG938_48510 [Streptomyces chartreusis]
MAVMTHVPIPLLTFPVAAHYRTFSARVQDTFDRHMEDADNAANDTAYFMAMIRAAQTVGMAIPATYDIGRCSCYTDAGGCGCDLIFDTAQPGVVVTENADSGFSLSRLQCPACGHDHPRPLAD